MFTFVLLLVSPLSGSAMGPWTAEPNPVISDNFPYGYGDADVVKIGSLYVMHLAHGDWTASNPDGVAISRALSTDGLSWTIDPSNRLAPSAQPGAFDEQKVETPSLVYFGNQWHMYYCGMGANGRYQIGQATSTDLYNWTRSRANPIMGINSIPGGNQVLHVCEPGAVVFNDKIYLFFVVTQVRPLPESAPPAKVSIYLATSTDTTGDSFTAPVEVLSQGPLFPASLGYAGYSTVNVQADGNTLHLFHDVFWYNGDPNSPWGGYYQAALGHATSADGMTWTEDDVPVLTRDQFAWTSREIRAPAVIRDGAEWKMWFSGDNISATTYTGQFSIGYATAAP